MKRVIAIILCAVILITGMLGAYKYVRFDISLDSGKNGTLTVRTVNAKPFESVKVYISPSRDEDYYVLDKLYVNGVDCTKDVKMDSITLKRVHKDMDIKATFKKSKPPITTAVFV